MKNINEKEKIDLRHITVIAGHFGSGKTEFAVNLAIENSKAGNKTRLIDLDIVNPYFRSFEAGDALKEADVDLIVSSIKGLADMPAIPAEVASIFISENINEIVDLGGDPAGAHLLGMYEQQLDDADFDFLYVYNANRPETNTAEKGLRYLENIEFSSKQKFTGIINNTHMMRETTAEDILRGQELALEIAEKSGLPLVYNVMTEEAYEDIKANADKLEAEAFIIKLHMNRPWEVV